MDQSGRDSDSTMVEEDLNGAASGGGPRLTDSYIHRHGIGETTSASDLVPLPLVDSASPSASVREGSTRVQPPFLATPQANDDVQSRPNSLSQAHALRIVEDRLSKSEALETELHEIIRRLQSLQISQNELGTALRAEAIRVGEASVGDGDSDNGNGGNGNTGNDNPVGE
ncbi:MAG: hypothetical protein Q9180_008293 [Flavoplaca navasiana]